MHAFDLDAAGRRGDPRPPRDAGRDDHDARRRRAQARRPTCWSSPTATARRRSPASWAARRPRCRRRRRTVAFESAYFKPASVRRTSKRLGLKTEASSRFERGADINAPVVALQRAIALMEQIGAGRVVGADRRRATRSRAGRRGCTCAATRLARAARRRRCPTRDVERILRGARARRHRGRRRLGRRRADLPRRSAARSRPHRGGRPPLRLRQARADVPGRHRAGAAARSAHPARSAGAPRADRGRPVRSGHVRLHRGEGRRARSSPDGADRPIARRQSAVREVRHAAAVAAAGPGRRGRAQPPARAATTCGCSRSARGSRRRGETRGVAVAWTGGGAGEHWSGGAREVDFFDVKGVVEQLCDALGVAGAVRAGARAVSRRRTRRRRCSPATARAVGIVGQLHAGRRRRARRCRGRIASSSPSWISIALAARRASTASDAVAAAAAASVRRPRSVDRRRRHLACGNHSWHHSGGRRERRRRRSSAIAFFDRYQGKGVPEGAVSLSVRLTFQAADRTLTDAEVQQSVDTILPRSCASTARCSDRRS